MDVVPSEKHRPSKFVRRGRNEQESDRCRVDSAGEGEPPCEPKYLGSDGASPSLRLCYERTNEHMFMISPDLNDLLCCPATHQPLREALPEELHAFGPELTAGLIREDGLVLYPVRNGIPLLLPGEAIPIRQEPSLQ